MTPDAKLERNATSSNELAVPDISLTEPTPVKPKTTLVDPNYSHPTPTGKRQPQQYRLLYKGSLLIEDDETSFPLDSICFVAHLPLQTPTSFMNNPLPLALESMHGRPSLRLSPAVPFTVDLKNRLDDSVDIRLYWQPESYYTHHFFMKTLWGTCGWDEEGCSKQCVRLVLGDEDGPDEHDVLIYGKITSTPATVRFLAARILPHRARLAPRPPRPDDPLPRRPMPVHASPGRKGTKRMLHASPEHDQARLKKKGRIIPSDLQLPVTGRMPFARAKTISSLSFGKGAAALPRTTLPLLHRSTTFASLLPNGRPRSRTNSVSSLQDEDDVFKVPSLPKRTKTSELGPSSSSAIQRGDTIKQNGSKSSEPPLNITSPDLTELELTNKTAIKKHTNSLLIARGVTKDHPDFKDIFNWTQRGVAFALRKQMNVRRLERDEIKVLVTRHLDMYAEDVDTFTANPPKPP